MSGLVRVLDGAAVDYDVLANGNVLVYDVSGEPAVVVLSGDAGGWREGTEVSLVGDVDEVPTDVLVVLPDVADSEKLVAIESATGEDLGAIGTAACWELQFATIGTAYGSAQNYCRSLAGLDWSTRAYYKFRVGLEWNYGACMRGQGHWRVIDPIDGSWYVAHGYFNIGCADPSVSVTTGSVPWGNVWATPRAKFAGKTIHWSGGRWSAT